MSSEDLHRTISNAIDSAGLSGSIMHDHVQVLNLAGQIFVEVVVVDATKEREVREIVSDSLRKANVEDSSLIVRSQWIISSIGNPSPAYGPDGGIRAAVLIPVTLTSGGEELLVTVAVTKLAEMELNRISGSAVSMRDVADFVVSNALRRGGQSYWNPRLDGYLEVGASVAPQISRFMKKSA